MTDSVAVFPPGYRLTDSDTGAPISGATISFYDAGTTTPRTVYGTKDLDQDANPVELGTSVTTDALGRPTSDGTTPTDIFVGTSPYKVVIQDGDGVTIETKDNRPGAVVSASSVDVSVTATFPVVTKSANYTVLATDQNTTFAINCSSADVTLTLPSAVDVGDGWKIKVQHAGSANQSLLAVKSGSGQIISEGSKSFGGAYALGLNGEDIEITSDGGNWRVSSHTTPFIKLAQGVIPITDRVSSPPGSPVQGALYILTGTSGDFSTFTSGDIVQYTGAGWINFTPYTDCGWIAYVADENLYYTYQDSAWVGGATASNVGMLRTATQSDQETATSTTVAVAPGTQQSHPGHPKVWGKTTGGGSPALAASYNMTSITDVGTGSLSITIATDFSGANWCATVNWGNSGNSAVPRTTEVNSMTAGGAGLVCRYANNGSENGNGADPSEWYWSGLGDQ